MAHKEVCLWALAMREIIQEMMWWKNWKWGFENPGCLGSVFALLRTERWVLKNAE